MNPSVFLLQSRPNLTGYESAAITDRLCYQTEGKLLRRVRFLHFSVDQMGPHWMCNNTG